MATDGPDPPPCSDELMKNGTFVLMTHTIPPNAFEGWLAKVRERCGQKIDWHYAGGRIRVLAMGDLEKVSEALEFFHAEHDQLYKDKLRKDGFLSEDDVLNYYGCPWYLPEKDDA
jgi:hypothetical protein